METPKRSTLSDALWFLALGAGGYFVGYQLIKWWETRDEQRPVTPPATREPEPEPEGW